MSVNCPSCGFILNPKSPKPGRFAPTCPKCSTKFVLIIPEDSSLPWKAELPEHASTRPAPPPVARPVVNVEDTAYTPKATDSRPDMGRTGDLSHAPQQPVLNLEATELPGRRDREQEGTRVAHAESMVIQHGEDGIPKTLGGYEIEKELGRGGMGAVYLARQVSLDRPVALKVMNDKWAADPVFLARFTREAYAAAQLVHHNVVQIYDIGEDKGVNFFSMEFVEGQSLGEAVKKKGKMDPREAAAAILQAARGLKFAHDRGMIHRDVKPDNLMLNNHGIVKVADLGLVKTPSMTAADDPKSRVISKGKLAGVSIEMTNAFTAMGSPAYMSPEQCRDAAHVDLRADIYSLGCTLYVLLTGKPPFDGVTAFEVMTKHTSEPPIPPHKLVKEVPEEMSTILLRMLAKDPKDRYANMQGLIDDLENFLGGGKGGEFRPNEEQTRQLEQLVGKYNAAPAAKLRKNLILGFLGLGALATLASLVAGRPLIAAAALATVLQTVIAYIVIQGLSQKTHLFRKCREWLFGSRLADWATYLVGFALFAGILVLTGLHWVWIGSALLAFLWATAFHATIDKKVTIQRAAGVAESELLLKRWRIQGFEEEKLRGHVARFAGKEWEEYFEEMFGFEAKRKAREVLAEGDGLGNRVKFAAWREPLLDRIEAMQTQRRDSKERKHLRKVESKKLEAEGATRADARAQAEARADRLVSRAADFRGSQRGNYDDMLDEASPLPKKAVKPLGMRLEEALEKVIGPKVRFLLGIALMVGACWWLKQNFGETAIRIADAAKGSDGGTVDKAGKAVSMLSGLFGSDIKTEALKIPAVPSVLTSMFDSANPLAAGFLLLLSLFFRGKKTAVCFLAGAGVAFLGPHLGVPEQGPLSGRQVSLAAGVALGVVGVLLSRKKT